MQLEFHQLDMRHEIHRVDDSAQLRRLVGSLAEHGQQQPVLVVAEGDRYVLVDGYRRVRALRRLGRDTVEAVVLQLPEPEALVLRYTLAAGQRWSTLEEGWLVQDLVEHHGLTQAELANQLGRSVSWVSRRLGLVRDLPMAVQDQVRGGSICAHAAMKYLLPLARAKESDCLALMSGLGGHQVTERQVHELYLAWRRATTEQWATIAASPFLYLKTIESAGAADAAAPEPVAETVEQALDRELNLLGSACWRVRRRVVELPATQSLSAMVVRAFRAADKAFLLLRTTMEEHQHARTSDPQCHLSASTGGARIPDHCPQPGDIPNNGQEGVVQ